MIECIDIIKIYEDIERRIQIPALRGCDLFVDNSEMISIIGPSGSGKTTLINILAGLESISSGQVIVAGYDLSRLSEIALNDYRKRIISIIQNFVQFKIWLPWWLYIITPLLALIVILGGWFIGIIPLVNNYRPIKVE